MNKEKYRYTENKLFISLFILNNQKNWSIGKNPNSKPIETQEKRSSFILNQMNKRKEVPFLF
jgi:hypothetical protein